MKKHLVMSRAKRQFLIVLRRLLVAVMVAAFVTLYCNSSIEVEINGNQYRQTIDPFEKRNTFEASRLFQAILEEEVRGITRMAVIKSQLETNGAYNGQKIIDIVEYAHRQEELYEETVTARFYLDDLVKWGNYGFVTETVCGTVQELNCWFEFGLGALSAINQERELYGNIYENINISGEEQNVLLKEFAQYARREQEEEEQQSLSLRMINELPSTREEYQRRAEEVGLYVEDSEILELQVLVPRYLSVDNWDLAEYASNVQEYVQLREDLKTTSKELFYNATEYWENKNAHAPERTNIRYCYRMSVNGQTLYLSNLEEDFTGKTPEEITERFAGFGSYIAYNADRAEITTNTDINAEQMKQEIGNYQYAFGDNTHAWIGVDTSYPMQDGLRMAQEAYSRVMPFYKYVVAAFLLATVLSLFLLVRLTCYEGREELEDKKGYRIVLRRADRMPTEPFFVCAVLGNGAIWAGAGLGYVFCVSTWADARYSLWLPLAAGGLSLFWDYVFVFFYLSLVRRSKTHTLWSNSWIRRFGIRFGKTMLSLYDNSHILTRSLVPFIVIVLSNLILGGFDIPGILAAAVIDVVAILVLYREKKALWEIVERTKRIRHGDFELKIEEKGLHGENRELAEAVNGIGEGIKTAVEQSMKDERLKADLITNVSHDIKTPLTSIINFVNLLKREKIEDERILGYIQVLDAKSQRLKQLTDDLVEASKITSGNISLQMERLNFAELVNQTCGEFSDKFQEKCLEMVLNTPDGPVYIEADSRRIWRVVENLFSNTYKYALEGTRVYLDIREMEIAGKRYAVFSMKNISAQALNIDAAELTERFIRGDISRSTEGSGLGLSIAKNLTELQNGKFEIYLDGDLFKVLVTFPCMEKRPDGQAARDVLRGSP